jgi:hypothetical protein
LLWRYVKGIFQIWSSWIFALFDTLAIVFTISGKTFIFQNWVYWLIGAIFFVIANFQLFAQMNQKITDYEATEAHLKIHVVDCFACFKRGIRKLGRCYGDGLGDNGIPIESVIRTELDIENLGVETGELEWKVDIDHSNLPKIFSQLDGSTNGSFERTNIPKVGGRDRSFFTWEIEIKLKETNPELFAKNLKDISVFQIVLIYHTKRIGEYSKDETLIIKGEFSYYCKDLIELWQWGKYKNLFELLQ